MNASPRVAGRTASAAAAGGPDWDARIRLAGLRSTAARRAILGAVHDLGHATVEELSAAVGDPEMSLSTVYRNLDALAAAGLVTHAHLHHGAPTYHSVDRAPHFHLVCTNCGQVSEEPVTIALELAASLAGRSGFRADLTHLVVHGVCAQCAAGTSAAAAALDPA